MIHRRFTRLILLFLVSWCLWWTFRSKFIVILPVLQSYSVPPEPCSRIAKVSVAVNSLNSSLIHDALRTHKVQNDIHGYKHFITTTEVVGDLSENDNQKRPRGAWSKPAYLMSIIVAELSKPESERLEWIFWFDADTIVMNPYTPLEIFLPPDAEPESSNIHLLMASNWDGLNSGAFALRVHPWTVSLLSAVLAYPVYRSEKLKTDRFRDQSAFQWLLQGHDSPLAATPWGSRNNWAEIPMRWFNSLPINNAFSKKQDWIFNHNMTDELFDKGTDEVYNDGRGTMVQPWKIKQGDMVLHCAGATPVRDSWMKGWLQRAQSYLPEWSNATKQEDLKVEVAEFWKNHVYQRALQEEQRLKTSQFNRTLPPVKGRPSKKTT